jgi:hypothetical protein
MPKFEDLLADGSNTAFITDTDHLIFLEKSLNGSKRFTKLQEIILSDHVGLMFSNLDFMLKPVNRIITQLLESGITDWIIKNETTIKYKEKDDKAMPLTLHHLWFWFSICGSMLTAAFCLLSGEILAHKFHTSMEKFKRSFMDKLASKFPKRIEVETPSLLSYSRVYLVSPISYSKKPSISKSKE